MMNTRILNMWPSLPHQIHAPKGGGGYPTHWWRAGPTAGHGRCSNVGV